jgi:hypothetical protein
MREVRDGARESKNALFYCIAHIPSGDIAAAFRQEKAWRSSENQPKTPYFPAIRWISGPESAIIRPKTAKKRSDPPYFFSYLVIV